MFCCLSIVIAVHAISIYVKYPSESKIKKQSRICFEHGINNAVSFCSFKFSEVVAGCLVFFFFFAPMEWCQWMWSHLYGIRCLYCELCLLTRVITFFASELLHLIHDFLVAGILPRTKAANVLSCWLSGTDGEMKSWIGCLAHSSTSWYVHRLTGSLLTCNVSTSLIHVSRQINTIFTVCSFGSVLVLFLC